MEPNEYKLHFLNIEVFKDPKRELALIFTIQYALEAFNRIRDHESRVNYHCLLFGKISEKDRVFTEGSLPLCFLIGATQGFVILFSLYLWYEIRKNRSVFWATTVRKRICWGIFLTYMAALYTLAHQGLRAVCNSLSAPSCRDGVVLYIDFKVFKPKYLNAWSFFSLWNTILENAQKSFISLAIFAFLNISKTPLEERLQMMTRKVREYL
ncbi:uncharacterized protein [Clytia hemisphaerica]|uniref:Uncharacterized protein n=1 Tax=Clytia hemisphaerica TaxID=252671 RepID=A0A7M5VCW6_9CNID